MRDDNIVIITAIFLIMFSYIWFLLRGSKKLEEEEIE